MPRPRKPASPFRYFNSSPEMAVYFRCVEDAQRCVQAFPEFELADGVASVTYYALGLRKP